MCAILILMFWLYDQFCEFLGLVSGLDFRILLICSLLVGFGLCCIGFGFIGVGFGCFACYFIEFVVCVIVG